MTTQYVIVQDLINKCRREEIKSFKSFLTTFDSGSGQYRGKSIQLLECFLSRKKFTEEEACINLYGDFQSKSQQAFNRLLNRFKSKLYECLCLDINIYRDDSLSEVTQYRLEMRKLIMYFFVLRGRLLNQEFIRLLERAIYIAKKYELYYDIVNLLYAKSEILSFISSLEKLRNIDQEIEYYNSAQTALREASNWHIRLLLAPGSKARGYDNISDFNLAIESIEKSVEKFKSANIEHYLLIIKMELAHKTYNYQLAEEISLRQLKLYTNSPAVFLKPRIASTYLNLGNNQMYLYKFDESYKNIILSYPIYSAYPLNLYIAKEIEFYVHFYSGEIIAARNLIEEIIEKGFSYSTPFQSSKRSFLYACTLVLCKENKTAHKILQDTKEIEKDKEGWNLGLRILSIINQLEAEKLDIVDLNIESMRKHIERTIKMKPVRKRDVIILKLLAKLSRHSFNFKQIWKKDQKYFELLASNEPEYRWEMKSPEMIVFHKWFEAKAHGREYDYVLKAPAVMQHEIVNGEDKL